MERSNFNSEHFNPCVFKTFKLYFEFSCEKGTPQTFQDLGPAQSVSGLNIEFPSEALASSLKPYSKNQVFVHMDSFQGFRFSDGSESLNCLRTTALYLIHLCLSGPGQCAAEWACNPG